VYLDVPIETEEVRTKLNTMQLTDTELSLLADSIFWEMSFLEKKGWHTCQRAAILTDLQNRIHAYLDNQNATR